MLAAGLVFLAAGLGAGPARAQPFQDIHLTCPCRVETSNPTSVTITFGLRNFHGSEAGNDLRVSLRGRRADSEDEWEVLATVVVPSIDPDTQLDAQPYTAAFKEPAGSGAYALDLALMQESWAVEAVAWIAEEIELSAGGSAWADVYFDGAPSARISGDQVTLTLPAIRNASPGSGTGALRAVLTSTTTADFSSSLILAQHSLGELSPGGLFSPETVTVPLDNAPEGDYLHAAIMRGGYAIAYQTVAVPDGEELPRRRIATHDASLFPDADGDGVGDVNERLSGTDPNDSGSTPGMSTIDVLALYSPGFAELYDGDPTTRIQHTMTLAGSVFSDSGLDMRLRLVGIAAADLDDSVEHTELDEEILAELAEKHGADMAVMYRPFVGDAALCGWAYVPGLRRNGDLEYGPAPLVHVFGDCNAGVTAHELGHAMGLVHSSAQGELGTYRWARGHGVLQTFNTVMAYASAYDSPRTLDRFSDPDADCDGLPCGVAEQEADGADAVKTLNAVRFQLEAISAPQKDSDGDGFVDPVDAFPNDPSERRDTDADGIGNNADPDDDNDGVIDEGDFYPLDPGEWSNTDGDALGDNADAFPEDPSEILDSDGDGVGDNTDVFPYDANETVDTDGDGVGNNADPFPYDTREWQDTDGDGIGDNADPDADNDGVPDERDAFPADSARSATSSWRFVVEGLIGNPGAAAVSSLGGRPGLLLGAPYRNIDDKSGVVHLLAVSDLSAADLADGAADQVVHLERLETLPASWRLVGAGGDVHGVSDASGYSVTEIGDVTGDGVTELLIGAPGHRPGEDLWFAGAAWLISVADLPAADLADGEADRMIQLERAAARPNSWKFTGEHAYDEAGNDVRSAGDINGDGRADIVIGARSELHGGAGAVYVMPSSALASADRADGEADGVISLARVAAQNGAWKFIGDPPDEQLAFKQAVGDIDGGGRAGLVLGAGRDSYGGPVHVVAIADLATADAADGRSDGVVAARHAAAGPNSWRFQARADSNPLVNGFSPGDIDGDDLPEWLLFTNFSMYLVKGADLKTADAADGSEDRVVHLHDTGDDSPWSLFGFGAHTSASVSLGRAAPAGGADIFVPDLFGGGRVVPLKDLAGGAAASGDEMGWRFEYPEDPEGGLYASHVVPAGDIDGDGREDIFAAAEDHDRIHLLASSDLDRLDQADGARNGSIGFRQVAGDADGDGIDNSIDPDDDGDGYEDHDDAFPEDPSEWADSDGDGAGDNADAFPADPGEQADFDGDGVGDNSDPDDDNDGAPDSQDAHPLDTDDDGVRNPADPDDDNDGTPDGDDAFPLDAGETADFDGDGVGDNADADDDNDGVADADDALPFDSADSVDTDGDGVGDSIDAFPSIASETRDTDGDGVGDNADTDDDGDGVPDSADAFPLDSTETLDTDGDGVGDNGDPFPRDSSEQRDSDGDGAGDNADTDDDGDGFTDNADLFPLDSRRQWLSLYRLEGERRNARAGAAVAPAGDINGDGLAEALIGSPVETRVGAVVDFGALYVLSGADTAAADRADGAADGVIGLGHVAGQPSSWAVRGGSAMDHLGASVSAHGAEAWLAGAHGRDFYRGAAYLISPGDMASADADTVRDGVVNIDDLERRSGSWSFLGEEGDNETGRHVALAGDMHADGFADYLIGAPFHDGRGAVWLVSGADLSGADAADGATDGRVDLARVADRPGSWKLIGERSGARAGTAAAAAGDIDGDGLGDFMVSAPLESRDQQHQGAVYVISAAGLEAADLADGSADGVVSLGNAGNQNGSWVILGEGLLDLAGSTVTAGDIDGDGNLELIVGAPEHKGVEGAVYIVPVTQLGGADTADGAADRVISLGNIASLDGAWKLAGEPGGGHWTLERGNSAGASLTVTDFDSDGRLDLLVGAPNHLYRRAWCAGPGSQQQPGAVYLVSGADLAAADRADGQSDGIVRLSRIASAPNSWKFVGEPTDRLGSAVSAAGDMDGDGQTDLLFGAAGQFTPHGDCDVAPGRGAGVIVSGAELALADRSDGSADGVIDLGALREFRRSRDFDYDGVENALDDDDDNDGVPDQADAFVLDAAESADHDHDGIGDNADPDDDNDGALDRFDAFPLNPLESLDSDGDGIGDNADPDDDNDGVSDSEDAFPRDPLETADSDGDGVGDNADPTPLDSVTDADGDGIADSKDTDDDNDGLYDWRDAYPLDPDRKDPFFVTLKKAGKFFAWDDFDGDGHDDLVVESQASPGVWVLLSSGDLVEAGSEPSGGGSPTASHVVEIDGQQARGRSWTLISTPGARFVAAGDVDSDQLADLIAGDLLVTSQALADADAADGSDDRSIRLADADPASQAGIWRLGDEIDEFTSYGHADLNGDGHDDLLIGSPGFPAVAYVLSGADWAFATGSRSSNNGGAATAAGTIRLDGLESRPGSWKLINRHAVDFGSAIAGGDVDGDGRDDLLIGAEGLGIGTNPDAGAVYLLRASTLGRADAADGSADGVIELGRGPAEGVDLLAGGGLAAGRSAASPGDLNGDGLAEVIVASTFRADLLSGADLASADAADGTVDGLIFLSSAADQPDSITLEGTYDFEALGAGPGDVDGDGIADLLTVAQGSDTAQLISGIDVFAPTWRNSWRFRFKSTELRFTGEVSAGDLTGDGQQEVIFGVTEADPDADGEGQRFAYIVSISELVALDRLDLARDRIIHLDRIAERWRAE